MKHTVGRATLFLLLTFRLAEAIDEAASSEEHQTSSVYGRPQRRPLSFGHKANSNKPKKYKCILVDDDDENENAMLRVPANSYVSELQQRRLQAAASRAAEEQFSTVSSFCVVYIQASYSGKPQTNKLPQNSYPRTTKPAVPIKEYPSR
jgi:hypothetical protein